jgi:hypothetical protein
VLAIRGASAAPRTRAAAIVSRKMARRHFFEQPTNRAVYRKLNRMLSG